MKRVWITAESLIEYVKKGGIVILKSHLVRGKRGRGVWN
jgi:hypothetical protein